MTNTNQNKDKDKKQESSPNNQFGDWLQSYMNILKEQKFLSVTLGYKFANRLTEWGMDCLRVIRTTVLSQSEIDKNETLVPVTMRTISLIMNEHKASHLLSTAEIKELVESLLSVWKTMTGGKLTAQQLFQTAKIIDDFSTLSAENLFSQLLQLVEVPPQLKAR